MQSVTEPAIYVAQNWHEEHRFLLLKVDCRLGSDRLAMRTVIYSGALGIQDDSFVNGVQDIYLLEKPGQRRILHVYLSGANDRAVVLYDVDASIVIDRMYTKIYNCAVDYLSLLCNPSATHCCVLNNDKSDFAVIRLSDSDTSEHDQSNETNVSQQETSDESMRDTCDIVDEGSEFVARKLDSLGEVCFKLKCQMLQRQYEWLNDDLVTFKTYSNVEARTEPCQYFYSVAQQRIIGSLHDDISFFFSHKSDVYFSAKDNIVMAFDRHCFIYRITLDPYFL